MGGKIGASGQGYEITPDQRKRFFKKIKREGDCWIWTSNAVPVPEGDGSGYPLFRLDSKTQIYAHRVSWMMRNGDIPLKGIIKRSCGKNLCVNPEHLYLWFRTVFPTETKVNKLRNVITYDPPEFLKDKKGGES